MDISATSFRVLLRDIFEAARLKESGMEYDNLLRKIFDEGAQYDKSSADLETRSRLWEEDFPSDKVLGREKEIVMLLAKLIGPVKNSVIPILGPSGIGKTTLARELYDQELVKKHFGLRAWVNVYGDGEDFNLRHAAQQILKSAMGTSCSLDDLDELDEMVRDTLQWQRCLIVFDGIESMTEDSWTHMSQYWFDFVDLGSRVVITTTCKDVADVVADQSFELMELSEDAALSVCRYLAFGSSKGVKEISRHMTRNMAVLCQNIPLSLNLVGRLMRYDHKLRDLLSSADFSDGISLRHLDASVAILLCLWALPPHLRQCLAYCAFFPKGYALSKERIIDMWIADGLVILSQGANRLEDIGNTYFLQLLCRSFFTDLTYGKNDEIIEFRLPGLIHKRTRDVAGIVCEEKLGVIGSIGEDADEFSLTLPMAGKYDPQHLRTLILSPTIHLGGSLDHLLIEFNGLHSLDLRCSGIQNLSDDIHVLKELRYLNLSYTCIQRLPDCISGLKELRTLDLSWCHYLKVLPRGMGNLTNMRHLDLSMCESLSCMPSGIGLLKSVISMPLFVLGNDDDCARLGELGNLAELRDRLEIRNLENARKSNKAEDKSSKAKDKSSDAEDRSSMAGDKSSEAKDKSSEAEDAKLAQKHLEYLGLSWSQKVDGSYEILAQLVPSPRLKVLHLSGYMGSKFPEWVSSIRTLVKISISDCGCKKLPSLGTLPNLKDLELKGMKNIQYIGPEFYGNKVAFPSLTQLGLHDLPMLLDWSNATTISNVSANQIVFPRLKTLTIEGCPQLDSLPSLPKLTHLIVYDSNGGIISSFNNFGSLSSLVINDMPLSIPLENLGKLSSLKKLILCNLKEVDFSHLFVLKFAALEHLAILHCQNVSGISLFYLFSLQKLHLVDCQNLEDIIFGRGVTTLIELVVEDCPKAYYSASKNIQSIRLLRKLIIRNSSEFIKDTEDFKTFEKLEYLFVSGCPQLEIQLEIEPSFICHIPCVILGNRKASYKGSSPKLLEYNPTSKSDLEEGSSLEMEQNMRRHSSELV